MILNYLYKDGAEKSILIISIINLLLNYIQQGRGGILVGTILLFLALYNYAPNQIRKPTNAPLIDSGIPYSKKAFITPSNGIKLGPDT